MISNPEIFTATIFDFDKANAEDPNTILIDGKSFAKEVVYAKRMTEWLHKIFPNATETLQLASRCQHIGRWEIPRSDYDTGRVGYIKWRNDLKILHAKKAGDIMVKNGYDTEIIERVQFLIQKKNLKRDSETQSLEDVICLVFLEYYFEDFASKHEEDKIIDIVAKTWKKMSTYAQKMALTIDFPQHLSSLIGKAIS